MCGQPVEPSYQDDYSDIEAYKAGKELNKIPILTCRREECSGKGITLSARTLGTVLKTLDKWGKMPVYNVYTGQKLK
jgi:hypothetical protein